MSTLSRIFHSSISALAQMRPSQREREDSYLAAAADIADLERRMRALERGVPARLPLGLGLR